jgi:hypothetical protein
MRDLFWDKGMRQSPCAQSAPASVCSRQAHSRLRHVQAQAPSPSILAFSPHLPFSTLAPSGVRAYHAYIPKPLSPTCLLRITSLRRQRSSLYVGSGRFVPLVDRSEAALFLMISLSRFMCDEVGCERATGKDRFSRFSRGWFLIFFFFFAVEVIDLRSR